MRIAVAGGTGIVGRYVVEAARAAGYDVVVIARSKEIDTISGEGLARALEGVQVIVDTTNAGTIEEGPATEFFRQSSINLQRYGAAAGVGHLVVLSIVGIDKVPTGYYAAKLAHEYAARQGDVATTIMRATQFHEFAGQVITWNREGALARVANLHVQTVAARTVGRVLVEVAGGPAVGRVADLGGPEREELTSLARRLVEGLDLGIEVLAVENPDAQADALLPGEDARIEGPTFNEWLLSDDAAIFV